MFNISALKTYHFKPVMYNTLLCAYVVKCTYIFLCLIINRYIILSIYAMNDILNKPSTDLAVNLRKNIGFTLRF